MRKRKSGQVDESLSFEMLFVEAAVHLSSVTYTFTIYTHLLYIINSGHG